MVEAKTIESKQRSTQKTESSARKKQTKLCLKCGRVKEFKDYFDNKEWTEQLGKDIWCKDCASKIKSKDEVREYFWENHREFTDRIWETAKKKAEGLVVTSATYAKASEDRKNKLLEQIACQQVFGVMNQPILYKYENTNKDGKYTSYAEAKENGEIIEDKDPNIKIWSDEWCGMFTEREIKWLDEYYKRLTENGKLEFDTTQDDYAHKIAHASLMNNKATSDYNAGRCDYSVVKDTASIFDMYNKSANFAACKRKTDTDNNKGSFSELVAYLESHGRPCTRKIEWDQDDVDRSIAELHHIVSAIGLDG